MDGWPVWLASISFRDRRGDIVPTEHWDAAHRQKADTMLELMIEGVGDDARERQFRMCMTMCRHRAVTVAERDSLPEQWHDAPAVDIAGGPVEVCWMKGVKDGPATRPCENMGKARVPSRNLRPLFLPVDCGECEPCVARANARSLPGGRETLDHRDNQHVVRLKR